MIMAQKSMLELEELSHAELPMPRGIKQFIYENTDYQKRKTDKVPRFVSVIEEWNGKLLQRTFAFISATKKRTYSDMKIREVSRDL